MNTALAELTVDEAEAYDKAQEYAAAAKKYRANKEYQHLAELYEQLSNGAKIIDVGIAIREGGFDHEMRPRLALARADRKQVRFQWHGHNEKGEFYAGNVNRYGCAIRFYQQFNEIIDFNRRHGKVHENSSGNNWPKTVEGFALVPLVPPDVRPSGPLKEFHILWEVEAWSDTPLDARPDIDPYLLRHIRGDLYEIIAEWDLTDLERAAMAGRARVE